MSVCFYDNFGIMVGVDLHIFLTIGPKGIPLAVPNIPHVVGVPNWWPAATFWKRTPTVTSDGWKMIQRGFKTFAVPHVFFTGLPPHPAEVGQLAKTIALSNSTSHMGIGSVTGEGAPLATCLAGPVGANKNCGGGGVVINPNSVVTSPTAADYASAAASALASYLLGKIPIPLLKPIVGSTVDKWVRTEVESWF